MLLDGVQPHTIAASYPERGYETGCETGRKRVREGMNQACKTYPRATGELVTLLDLCVSSLRRGHANLLCTVPISTDDPRRES